MTDTLLNDVAAGARSLAAPCLPALAGLVLTTTPALARQDAPEAPAPEEDPAPAVLDLADEVSGTTAPELSGLAWLRMRGRWNADEEDQDLFGYVSLDYGDVGANGWSAHVAAALFADIDGAEGGAYTFVGIHDADDDAVNARLDLGYVDTNLGGDLELLRVGRQQVYATPEFGWFDGVRVEHGRLHDGLLLGAWGGVAVRPWQSEDVDDLTGGAYVALEPWWRGRLRLDYMRFEDDSLVGMGGNDLLAVGLRQGIREGLEFELDYSRLDDEDRDAEVALWSWGLAEDLTFRLSHYELIEPQGQLANELDPFTSSTFTLQPYRESRALVSQGFGDHTVVELGGAVRRVADEDDLGEYNRDFERYFVRGLLLDLGDSGFDVTLTGEAWRSEGNDLETWGLDVQRELSERLEVGIGSYYSLYKYDLYLNAERDDVRTYHVELEYDWYEDLRVDLDYVFEDDDFGNQNTLRLGLRWSI